MDPAVLARGCPVLCRVHARGWLCTASTKRAPSAPPCPCPCLQERDAFLTLYPQGYHKTGWGSRGATLQLVVLLETAHAASRRGGWPGCREGLRAWARLRRCCCFPVFVLVDPLLSPFRPCCRQAGAARLHPAPRAGGRQQRQQHAAEHNQLSTAAAGAAAAVLAPASWGYVRLLPLVLVLLVPAAPCCVPQPQSRVCCLSVPACRST